MSAAADDRLANLLTTLARGIADLEASELRRQTGGHGSAPTALLGLREHPDGLNIARLAAMLGLTHSGAVRLVQQLEQDGLVRRLAGPDRRQVVVRLSAKGRRVADRAAAERLNATRELVTALPRTGRRELEQQMDALVGALARRRAEQRRADPAAAGEAWLCRTCDFTACGRAAGRCPAANAAAAVFGGS